MESNQGSMSTQFKMTALISFLNELIVSNYTGTIQFDMVNGCLVDRFKIYKVEHRRLIKGHDLTIEFNNN